MPHQKSWLRPAVSSLGLALTLAGCGAGAHPATAPTRVATAPSPSSRTAVPAASSLDPLTGLPTPVHGPLIAVMVENSEYGRPQYGLRSADIVYEAYTEFFYYSRFLLLYWGQDPVKVGPVRSARPYFVSWVHAWPAAYVHAGASDPGYVSIARDHIHNLDLDANAQNLGYRVATRPAPHNLFTNLVVDARVADRLWGNPHVASPWPFRSHHTSGTPPYRTITLTFNDRNTIEQWRWDRARRGWTRWVKCPECPNNQWTQVMGLNSGQPVVASNIVIQYTNEQYLYDPAHTGWIQIQTHGTGAALLFLGHRFYRGTWKNGGPGQPTQYFLDNGQRAVFSPGQTWIEVVPNARSAPNPFRLTLSRS